MTGLHKWSFNIGQPPPFRKREMTCQMRVSPLRGPSDRGVKLTSQNIGPQGSETDTYSFDPNFDYLTGTTYTDNVSPSSETWSYDAAGNRTDSVVDNLNRTTSIQGTATCDILGNRLAWGSNSYGWDCLNRMTSYSGTGGSATYAYRVDGTRVAKSATIGGTATATTYAYDGQMGFEDTDVSGGSTTVTDYGLGARGIDWIDKAGSISFPCYDAHGNMVNTIVRNGAGGYSLGMNTRSFDAWGGIRLGNGSGDPKGRYCASLGHKQDDESGLVYMRARYYEPQSGRFVSEDPSMQGRNLFVYCGNDPVDAADSTGHCLFFILGLVGGFIAALQTFLIEGGTDDNANQVAEKVVAAFAIGFAAGALAALGPVAGAISGAVGAFVSSVMGDIISGGWGSVNWKKAFTSLGIGGLAGAVFGAVGAVYGDELAVEAELSDIDSDGSISACVGNGIGAWTGGAVGTAGGSAAYPE